MNITEDVRGAGVFRLPDLHDRLTDLVDHNLFGA